MNRLWGTSYADDEVMITTGSQQALDLVGKLLLADGDEVVCESPTYLGAISAWNVFRPRWVEVPTDDEGMDPAALAESLDRNQARRHPFHHLSLEDVAGSTVRIQENNLDTILALAQRTFGCAYQFVPPMSITLGMRECLGTRKVRVYSDTGSWKQTALRVALFSEPTPEYPMTLLQRHPDALITATRDTARHPISENPDWQIL